MALAGAASLAFALIAFMAYELLAPPPRYRSIGPGQIQEAVDNRFGFSGGAYREDSPDPEGRKMPRNAPCPCGSGVKFKRCCGRVAE